MRKSKQEAAETRRRIVKAAAKFRLNGIGGTGLSDLMAAAGLTHGGFYRHFESKDQLVAEACAAATESAIATFFSNKFPKADLRRGSQNTYRRLIETILPPAARWPRLAVRLPDATKKPAQRRRKLFWNW